MCRVARTKRRASDGVPRLYRPAPIELCATESISFVALVKKGRPCYSRSHEIHHSEICRPAGGRVTRRDLIARSKGYRSEYHRIQTRTHATAAYVALQRDTVCLSLSLFLSISRLQYIENISEALTMGPIIASRGCIDGYTHR